MARIQKTATLNPSALAGTNRSSYPRGFPFSSMYAGSVKVNNSFSSLYLSDSNIVATTHGSPSPKNTFTEFEPVTFPIAASASLSY